MGKSTIFFVDHKTDQEAFLKEKGITLVSPETIVEENLKDTDALIIKCELNINEHGVASKLDDFYGVQLAQRLRIRKFKGPILFVSLMPRHLLSNHNLNNSIVNTIGHSFIQLPSHPDEWIKKIEETNTLSEVEWLDIESNYCNKTGLVQQKLHALYGIVKGGENHMDDIKSEIHNSVKVIGEMFDYDTSTFLSNLNFLDSQNTIREVQSFCENILMANAENDERSTLLVKKRPWSVLVLDDEMTENHDFIKQLKLFVEEVYCVRNAKEAEELLKTNLSEGLRIAMVISDYRLVTTIDKCTVHQEFQGYTFLANTSETYSYLGLVALSAMPRKFLFQSFRKIGLQLDVYSKKDYLDSKKTMELLIDELIKKGDEAFLMDIRSMRMSSKNWENFESFYIYHRKSLDYVTNERYISKKAKNYCTGYLNGDKQFDLTGYTTELKGKSKIPENKKYFSEFLEKMVCRRAVLWYFMISERAPSTYPREAEDVLKFLKGSNFKGTENSNTAKNQINTNLALRKLDFPWNTTLEERNWLIDDMKFSEKRIVEIETLENEILEACEKQMLSLKGIKTIYSCKTFLQTKYLLKEHLNFISPKNYGDLLKVIGNIRVKIANINPNINTVPSKNVINFNDYLGKLQLYLQRYKKAVEDNVLKKDIVTLKQEFLVKASNAFAKSENLSQGIPGSLEIFFVEKKKSLEEKMGNFDELYQQFITFHKKESLVTDPRNSSIPFESNEFRFGDDSHLDIGRF